MYNIHYKTSLREINSVKTIVYNQYLSKLGTDKNIFGKFTKVNSFNDGVFYNFMKQQLINDDKEIKNIKTLSVVLSFNLDDKLYFSRLYSNGGEMHRIGFKNALDSKYSFDNTTSNIRTYYDSSLKFSNSISDEYLSVFERCILDELKHSVKKIEFSWKHNDIIIHYVNKSVKLLDELSSTQIKKIFITFELYRRFRILNKIKGRPEYNISYRRVVNGIVIIDNIVSDEDKLMISELADKFKGVDFVLQK